MKPGDLLRVFDHYGETEKIVLGNIDTRKQQILIPVDALCVFIRYTSYDKRKVVVLCGEHVGWLWTEEVRLVDDVAIATVDSSSRNSDVHIEKIAEEQQM